MGKDTPYTGRWNPRFVTVRRGGMLEHPQHRLLAAWAADCAEHVLDYFCTLVLSDEDLRNHKFWSLFQC